MSAALFGCRIEWGTPSTVSQADGQRRDVWVYTSFYRTMLDALEPELSRQVPQVNVKWFQSGSEKVATRLEAEFAAGTTQADVVIISDPFLYERYKNEGRWRRYVSPSSLRVPSTLIDLDGHFTANRVSTMVIVARAGKKAPKSFGELAAPAWKDVVALADPLTSGTAMTWAYFMMKTQGPDYFLRLRKNGARIAGGSAAVIQKIETGESDVGIALLENVLTSRAKGSPIDIVWPEEGAVIIPGFSAILATSKNPDGAQRVLDAFASPQVQALIAQVGDMHATDPRVGGPRDIEKLSDLLRRAQPWDESTLAHGLSEQERVKTAFREAFAQ